jgi:hypothetical protein
MSTVPITDEAEELYLARSAPGPADAKPKGA